MREFRMKIQPFIAMALFLLLNYFASAVAAKGSGGTVTCYEKTPPCYATQDSSGCIRITDVKPTGNSCKIAGRETKTEYDFKKGTSSKVEKPDKAD
jgi:hypothetical protein